MLTKTVQLITQREFACEALSIASLHLHKRGRRSLSFSQLCAFPRNPTRQINILKRGVQRDNRLLFQPLVPKRRARDTALLLGRVNQGTCFSLPEKVKSCNFRRQQTTGDNASKHLKSQEITQTKSYMILRRTKQSFETSSFRAHGPWIVRESSRMHKSNRLEAVGVLKDSVVVTNKSGFFYSSRVIGKCGSRYVI